MLRTLSFKNLQKQYYAYVQTTITANSLFIVTDYFMSSVSLTNKTQRENSVLAVSWPHPCHNAAATCELSLGFQSFDIKFC